MARKTEFKLWIPTGPCGREGPTRFCIQLFTDREFGGIQGMLHILEVQSPAGARRAEVAILSFLLWIKAVLCAVSQGRNLTRAQYKLSSLGLEACTF